MARRSRCIPDMPATSINGNSFLDLSLNIFNEKSFFLNSTIDRAYVQYTHQNFVATVGRQRINWGQSFVWNPNDIFNVQNYFDFDYIEKPGSDAVRLQYYTGYASDAELAAKLDQDKRLTAAGYFRFNDWNYDFQVLGGLFAGEDLMAGLGWSGSVKGAGFRGETSYFRSKGPFQGYDRIFSTSIFQPTIPSGIPYIYRLKDCMRNSREASVSMTSCFTTSDP